MPNPVYGCYILCNPAFLPLHHISPTAPHFNVHTPTSSCEYGALSPAAIAPVMAPTTGAGALPIRHPVPIPGGGSMRSTTSSQRASSCCCYLVRTHWFALTVHTCPHHVPCHIPHPHVLTCFLFGVGRCDVRLREKDSRDVAGNNSRVAMMGMRERRCANR